ncbi:MAG: hypothetical protein DMG50_02110 [Acidobacteria bacterium]|nr:MAG: hypothetical protein DMG50_02110 [Acidobacteriota bacterium]
MYFGPSLASCTQFRLSDTFSGSGSSTVSTKELALDAGQFVFKLRNHAIPEGQPIIAATHRSPATLVAFDWATLNS